MLLEDRHDCASLNLLFLISPKFRWLFFFQPYLFLGVLTVAADRERLRTLTILFTSFFLGGIIGAIGFKSIGYSATVLLPALLIVPASLPAWDDLMTLFHPKRT